MNRFVNISTAHGITTRRGGVSIGPFESMNTGFYGDDDKIKVYENIKRALDQINSDAKVIIATRQVHSNNICIIDDSTDLDTFVEYDVSGTALDGYRLLSAPETDGLLSTRKDVVLMTFYADCVPLVFYDANRGVVGSVHSGWRGTANLMAQEAIDKCLGLGCVLEDIKIGIGHCAGSCCYEVDEPVIEAFRKHFTSEELTAFVVEKDNGKFQLDLKTANVISFLKKGVQRAQIEVNNDCTICDFENYHSHRRTGYPRGSMSAFIQLK